MTAQDKTVIALNVRVEVKRVQQRLGSPKYPGRQGTVVRENMLGRDKHGSLWYVLLDATKRSKAREETFWTHDLIELPQPPAEVTSDPAVSAASQADRSMSQMSGVSA